MGAPASSGRQGPPSAGRSPSRGVTHSKHPDILPFHSLTYFQPQTLWRSPTPTFLTCADFESNQIAIFFIGKIFANHQTFYFDFHGFCSDSLLPLLAPIDGPSVRFMSWAQLESQLMVERTMLGGTHKIPNGGHSDPDSFNSTSPPLKPSLAEWDKETPKGELDTSKVKVTQSLFPG